MTSTYKVSGMTCDGCKRTVENILKNVDGVFSAEANVKKGEVIIESDANVGLQHLKDALADFGQYNIAEFE